MSKMRTLAFAAVLVLFSGLPAQAKPPALAAIPDYLLAKDKATLSDQRALLEKQWSAVIDLIAPHDKRCGHVPDTDASLVESCGAEEQKIEDEIARLKKLTANFNELVAEKSREAAAVDPGPAAGVIAATHGAYSIVDKGGNQIDIAASGAIQIPSGATIRTGADARVQILLLDETVFTIGPNSETVIDEFVYDPKDATLSKASFNILKGFFRFVSGKVAPGHERGVRATIPVGDLGFRGTDVEVTVNPDMSGSVALHDGMVDLTPSSGGDVLVIKPGEMYSYDAEGRLSGPVPIK